LKRKVAKWGTHKKNKKIKKCFGDIGRAKSTIFRTFHNTSRFWQITQHEDLSLARVLSIPVL
jgi:hypothetical protein